MIRVISLLCKINSLKISDIFLFNKSIELISRQNFTCPHCKATNLYERHSSYSRMMISFSGDSRNEISVNIPRIRCHCGKTHALIPANLVPFSSYSIRFILIALFKFITRRCSVAEFCDKHHIAISTIYKWKSLLLQHYNLWAGAINEIATITTTVIDAILNNSSIVIDFANRFKFSFLQQHIPESTCLKLKD